MRKDENGKEKRIDITGRRIWTAAIVINVIPVLMKLLMCCTLNIRLEKSLIILISCY